MTCLLRMPPRLVVVGAIMSFALEAAAAEDGGTISGCVESIPPGGQRPRLMETFPPRGTSGYVAVLKVTVEHGKGESVLPRGLELESAGEAAKMLKVAGFALPDQDGGAGAELTVSAPDPAHPDRVTTTLQLPLVALPAEPGRQALTLPPLPVAVARANGEIATACTRTHVITVEDPTASVPDAKPMPNPAPRAQREEWTALKKGLLWASLGLLVGGILAYLARSWMKRPRPVAPPPPPRPPWEIALERLDEVRHAGLLEQGRHADYFDRVSDAVRSYLGARYGFDALESTTDEILQFMKQAQQIHGVAVPEIAVFLQECDLVKFANLLPTPEACAGVLDGGERIVRETMPRSRAFDSSPKSTREVRL